MHRAALMCTLALAPACSCEDTTGELADAGTADASVDLDAALLDATATDATALDADSYCTSSATREWEALDPYPAISGRRSPKITPPSILLGRAS